MRELQGEGKSGVVGQNLTKPKRMKEVVPRVPKIPQPEEKEKDLETIREGKVKFYAIAGGYGFICEEGVRDYFFHNSEMDDEGKVFATGDRVSFIAKASPKGWTAVDVRRIR